MTLGIQRASPTLSQDWRQSSEKKHWWEGKFAIYICSVVSALQHKFLGHDSIISTSQTRKLRFQDIEKLAYVYICGSRGDSQGERRVVERWWGKHHKKRGPESLCHKARGTEDVKRNKEKRG